MTDDTRDTSSSHHRSGGVLARIRAKLAGIAAEPNTETVTEPAPEPPRREHLFGSQYRVRMSFDELMATRGYTGQQVQMRRRLVAPSDDERQRRAATRRAGYRPGEVLWPSD